MIGLLPNSLDLAAEAFDNTAAAIEEAARRIEESEDRISRAQFQLEFGVIDVAQAFRKTTQELQELLPAAGELLGVDINTAEGRAAALELLKGLASQVTTAEVVPGGVSIGAFDPVTGQRIGSVQVLADLSEEEIDLAQALLRELKGLVGVAERAEGGPMSAVVRRAPSVARLDDAPEFKDTFQRLGSITESTAGQLLQETTTQTFLQADIAASNRGILKALGGDLSFAGLLPGGGLELLLPGATGNTFNFSPSFSVFATEGTDVAELAGELSVVMAEAVEAQLRASGRVEEFTVG